MYLYILETKFSYNGVAQTLFLVILQSEKETILVDCGYAGFLPLIEEAAGVYGLSLQQLTGIIITQHDVDHLGGLHELKEQYPHINVYVFKEEASYISGRKKSLRLQQAEALYSSLPEEQKTGALQFQELLKSMRRVAVDKVFRKKNCLC